MCTRICMRIRWHRAAFCVVLLAPLPVLAQSWKPWLSPAAMARIDASMLPVERSSFCSENCRYDRHGVGDEPATANPRPDRWLYLDAGEAVLYDDPGAGVITRIWLTSGGPTPTCLEPTLRIKMYFGTATAPAIDVQLRHLFDGSTAPFQSPLSFNKDTSSGGYTSYVPIRYADGIRVAIDGLDVAGPCSTDTPPKPPRLWYQIDAQHLPPGTVTGNFSLADSFPALVQFLGATGDDPWARGLQAQAASHSMGPLSEWTIANNSGSGWLAGLRIRAPAAVWPQLDLELTVDGDTAAAMPLSAFTGVDPGDPLPPRSPLMGVDARGWLYLWWPVPYRHDIELVLRDGGLTAKHAVQVQTFWDASAVPTDAGQWFARWHNECSFGVHHQQTLLALDGSGKLTALAGRFVQDDGTDPRYLEGDTRLRFDRAVAPQWQGSGLEDFYNGGFYFDWGTPYRQPWSGASAVDIHGVSAMWRLLLADAPVFINGINVLQEAGASPNEALSVCMDTVAYAYHTASRALVPVARLDVADPVASLRFAYQHPPSAKCSTFNAHFADAANTARDASVCRYDDGSSSFHMRLPEPSSTLRLRRIVDANDPGQAARILINGVTAGYFPPVRPDSVRRWQEQDAPLAVAPGSIELDIEIQPLWGVHGDVGTFSESVYELWTVPGDALFADGFERRSPR